MPTKQQLAARRRAARKRNLNQKSTPWYRGLGRFAACCAVALVLVLGGLAAYDYFVRGPIATAQIEQLNKLVKEAKAPPAAPVVTAPPVAAKGTCLVLDSVYVDQIDACVRRETNVAELQKVSPDLNNDPNCKGKPPGHRYDKAVIGPDGAKGIAHVVCGTRPKT
ncbi:MAG: hypothetical protein Q7S50_04245 [bacterium]|nr:hypothetical protein [bacterium]